jgi:hypothetical protein
MSEQIDDIYKPERIKAKLISLDSDIFIHIEDRGSKVFWINLFKSINPTIDTKIQVHNGCDAIIRSIILPDNAFEQQIVILDSDYHRYLDPNECATFESDFIFQTYYHSVECYVGNPALLVSNCLSATTEAPNFDFAHFFKAYSKAIYPMFLRFIHEKQKKSTKIDDGNFLKIISFDFCQNNEIRTESNKTHQGLIEQNGKVIIDHVQKKVQEYLSNNPVADNEALAATSQHLRSKGVTEDNAFGFIRGHNLYAWLLCLLENVAEHDCMTKAENEIANSSDLNEEQKKVQKNNLYNHAGYRRGKENPGEGLEKKMKTLLDNNLVRMDSTLPFFVKNKEKITHFFNKYWS